MPARAGALAAAGKHVRPDQFDNSTVVAGAKVAFLGDVFVWPAPLPLANVFSIGDVMLTAGVGVVLHGACGSRLGRRRQPSSGLHALPFDRPATVAPFAPPAVGLVITAAGFVGRSCPLGGAGSSAHRARRAQSSPGLRITSAAGSPL